MFSSAIFFKVESSADNVVCFKSAFSNSPSDAAAALFESRDVGARSESSADLASRFALNAPSSRDAFLRV